MFLLPSCMFLLQLVRVKRSNDWKERLRYIHFTIPFPSIFFTLRTRIALPWLKALRKERRICFVHLGIIIINFFISYLTRERTPAPPWPPPAGCCPHCPPRRSQRPCSQSSAATGLWGTQQQNYSDYLRQIIYRDKTSKII